MRKINMTWIHGHFNKAVKSLLTGQIKKQVNFEKQWTFFIPTKLLALLAETSGAGT